MLSKMALTNPRPNVDCQVGVGSVCTGIKLALRTRRTRKTLPLYACFNSDHGVDRIKVPTKMAAQRPAAGKSRTMFATIVARMITATINNLPRSRGDSTDDDLTIG